ncbi:MAG: U32 family peptidase C-terminal domain-containing protein, partial [Firmicutes bacterium]|nr:U32 family peptidase C-terminal domain-containing protein [Bacillota bacterium]
DLERAVEYAHSKGVKVYITANIFAHESDFSGMADYFRALRDIGADALIVADPGVFDLARETLPDTDLHISTQANNVNSRSALFWHKMGAKRIVLARELSIEEIAMIRRNTPESLELEAFVHGAMCISYSGRCLLSSYLTGRDGNKGDCAQPCRWKYNMEYSMTEQNRPDTPLTLVDDPEGSFVLNSKDLCLIEHIPELINAGILSFKIEGRMKTAYYVAAVTKAYREAIDLYFSDPMEYTRQKTRLFEETLKVSHRPYTTGFYFQKADRNTQVYESSSYIREYDYIAVALEDSSPDGTTFIAQRNKFSVEDEIEALPACSRNFFFIPGQMWDEEGNEVKSAPHPEQKLIIKLPIPVSKGDMFRKKR